jgi:hypothetical protein
MLTQIKDSVAIFGFQPNFWKKSKFSDLAKILCGVSQWLSKFTLQFW